MDHTNPLPSPAPLAPHIVWQPKVRVSSTLTIGRDSMTMPRDLAAAHHVFVFHEADLFAAPEPIICEVFRVMNEEAHHEFEAGLRHEFQVATKHPERALAMSGLIWSSNIWLGARLQDDGSPQRLAALRQVPAAVKFAHLQPRRAGPPVDVFGLDFVIVQAAGEPAWMKALTSACQAVNARLFVGLRVENAPLRHDPETTGLAVNDPGDMRRG